MYDPETTHSYLEAHLLTAIIIRKNRLLGDRLKRILTTVLVRQTAEEGFVHQMHEEFMEASKVKSPSGKEEQCYKSSINPPATLTKSSQGLQRKCINIQNWRLFFFKIIKHIYLIRGCCLLFEKLNTIREIYSVNSTLQTLWGPSPQTFSPQQCWQSKGNFV